MKSTLENYKKVYRMLEDKESRDIYLNRLNWLISDDNRYIENIVSRYLKNMGAYCGKTVADLRDSMPKDRKIILYGAGKFADYTFSVWESDERFAGFCSKTKSKQEHGYLGYPVISPEALLAQSDFNVVVNTTTFRDEILQILQEGGYPQEQIFDVTSYFQVSDYVNQYFGPSFMRFEDEEVFIDAGSCDLDTSLNLRNYCKAVKKVYAFEPDRDAYQRCVENSRKLPECQVKITPCGTWSESTELCFHKGNLGASAICAEGEETVRVVSIDEIVDASERVTMIKMDVEGAELESLKGARETILRDKPKLAVCIYHKPEDMTEIPLYIKELAPEYKIYIRHHSNHCGETVLYAVMP